MWFLIYLMVFFQFAQKIVWLTQIIHRDSLGRMRKPTGELKTGDIVEDRHYGNSRERR